MKSQRISVAKSCINKNTVLSLLETLLHGSNPGGCKRSVNILTCLEHQDLQIKWFKSFLNQLLRLLEAAGLYKH